MRKRPFTMLEGRESELAAREERGVYIVHQRMVGGGLADLNASTLPSDGRRVGEHGLRRRRTDHRYVKGALCEQRRHARTEIELTGKP